MSGPITRPIDNEAGAAPSYPAPYSNSVGRDESLHAAPGSSVVKLVLDFGKSANQMWLAALICGACMATTIITVWHSKERETATNARLQVMQNHADKAAQESQRATEDVKLLRQRLENEHANRR